jgi:hypothetical protein
MVSKVRKKMMNWKVKGIAWIIHSECTTHV